VDRSGTGLLYVGVTQVLFYCNEARLSSAAVDINSSRTHKVSSGISDCGTNFFKERILENYSDITAKKL
jgi:hypothetical protein